MNNGSSWIPIEEKPKSNTAGLLLCSKRVWYDTEGSVVFFSPERDLAERVEVAFFEDGQWLEANTAHSVFHDFREKDELPTHWMPISGIGR